MAKSDKLQLVPRINDQEKGNTPFPISMAQQRPQLQNEAPIDNFATPIVNFCNANVAVETFEVSAFCKK